MNEKTLAQELADEADLLRRKVVHATRPRRPLSMDYAAELNRKMEAKISATLTDALLE